MDKQTAQTRPLFFCELLGSLAPRMALSGETRTEKSRSLGSWMIEYEFRFGGTTPKEGRVIVAEGWAISANDVSAKPHRSAA
jgi:hypothetical protein